MPFVEGIEMIAFQLLIDTQRVSGTTVRSIISIARPVSVRGLVNTRWDEFSALEVAEVAGLRNVEWDYVSDDTPGSLDVTVLYPESRCRELRALIECEAGITYQTLMRLMSTTDRQTAQTDFR